MKITSNSGFCFVYATSYGSLTRNPLDFSTVFVDNIIILSVRMNISTDIVDILKLLLVSSTNIVYNIIYNLLLFDIIFLYGGLMKINYKKYLRITLIIIGVIVGIILIDTLQARIFKNSPIISTRRELEDDDSYVDKGVLIDTYYCTKEKDIVTVSYHFKGEKFTCPVDNVKEYSERAQNLINLLKEKMIEMEILDEDNLETLTFIRIYESGYYTDSPQKKHISFEFNYSCKDRTKKCMPELFKKYGTIYDDYAIIWAYADEKEIYELSRGFAINFNDLHYDNYKQVYIEIK